MAQGKMALDEKNLLEPWHELPWMMLFGLLGFFFFKAHFFEVDLMNLIVEAPKSPPKNPQIIHMW
jgi:hypothetical protein